MIFVLSFSNYKLYTFNKIYELEKFTKAVGGNFVVFKKKPSEEEIKQELNNYWRF